MHSSHARRRTRRWALTAALAAIAAMQLAPAAFADHIRPAKNPYQVAPNGTQPWGSPNPDPRHWQVGPATDVDCSGGEQPGTRDLYNFLEYHWPRGEFNGIYNCRPPSLHGHGRAIDYSLNKNDAGDKAAGDEISAAFRRQDSGGAKWALARRFGVQEIIWNCKIWTAARAKDGWRQYSRCDPSSSDYSTSPTYRHEDHIHIGLNWGGAKQGKTAWTGYHYCHQCTLLNVTFEPMVDYDTGDVYDPVTPDPLLP